MIDFPRPRDPEAERWTIGSMLIDGTTAAEVFAIVHPNDFDDELAQAAAQACHDALQAGEPIDIKLVLRRMRQTGGDVGEYAASYLAEVAQEIPTAANAKLYAGKVAEASRNRGVVDICLRAAHEASKGSPSTETITRVLTDTSNLVDRHGTKGDPWQAWERSLDDLDRVTYWEPGGPNSQLNRVGMGPEQLILFGAIPGLGKTALVSQLLVNSLLANPDFVGMFFNCEMATGVILDRQVARLAHVSYGVVRDRTYRGETRDRVMAASKVLLGLRHRLHFGGPPFTMARVRALSASVGANIVVVDYVQRFRPTTEATDQRAKVSDVMSDCREIAMTGPCVLAVSALSRTGQFRESSECEYACDSGFVLKEAEHQDPSVPGRQLIAECIKNRHGAQDNIELTFDGRYQEHTAPSEVEEWGEFAAYGGEASLV